MLPCRSQCSFTPSRFCFYAALFYLFFPDHRTSQYFAAFSHVSFHLATFWFFLFFTVLLNPPSRFAPHLPCLASCLGALSFLAAPFPSCATPFLFSWLPHQSPFPSSPPFQWLFLVVRPTHVFTSFWTVYPVFGVLISSFLLSLSFLQPERRLPLLLI